MSKQDSKIVNTLKMLALDMISAAGSGDVGLTMASAHIFEVLYLKHLNYVLDNPTWINRDRLLVSNSLLPLYYAANSLFTKYIPIDNLKDYKKLGSTINGYAKLNDITPYGSVTEADIIPEAVGIALGERYLESLIKIEDKNCHLVNFKTYCICTTEDLMNGLCYEAMSFASAEELKNLVFIVINHDISKDSYTSEVFTENLTDRFISLNFEIDTINATLNSIDGALLDASKSKKPTVIFVNTTYAKDTKREDTADYYNMPLESSELESLRSKYKLTTPFSVLDNIQADIDDEVSKRVTKVYNKWTREKEKYIGDLKIKEIINFLETKKIKLNYKTENIKLNDNYEESLILSNHKIFNILASKSPFILSGSNDNFLHTLGNISKSGIMSKSDATNRNILFGKRPNSMGFIACGMASLGLKIFISAPLEAASFLKKSMELATINNLPVTFIFTQDTFLNTYENLGIPALNELNNLRSIPNLINFRPADINEILGTYEVISTYPNAATIVIGSSKMPKLPGTNSKYVIAGAYRVKKEATPNYAIIIATGGEVAIALRVAEELKPYGIDLRVISMPAKELFTLQNAKYQNVLIPKNTPTFTLEFASTNSWYDYATSKEYILGINNFTTSGTKEELLNFYNLDMDSLKAKIIELLKN